MFLLNNDIYTVIGQSGTNTVKKLDPSVYNITIPTMMDPTTKLTKNDTYKQGIWINAGVYKEARDFMNNFFTESIMEARKILNMKNKVGIMFNGEGGTGKTYYAGMLAEEICQKHNAIGILATVSTDYSDIIDQIRSDDPDRKIVLIMDEFEKTFRSYDTAMLSFLSGAKERDNLIIIATVNETNNLPGYIQDRPSRFEKIFEFKFKDDVVLESVINSLIPDSYKSKLDIMSLVNKVKDYDNMSIDRIKHILRDVIASNITFEKTGEVIEVIISASENKRSVGFIQPADEVLQLSELLERCPTIEDNPFEVEDIQLN
jgi:hypothetical protein